MLVRKLYAIILFLFLTLATSAAEVGHRLFMYEHLGTTDGLSSQRVYSLAEDCHGGIWAGMKNGVARYNGRTLVNYSLPLGTRSTDTGGMIIKMLISPADSIMAYDNKGNIFCYNPAADRFDISQPTLTAFFNGETSRQDPLMLNSLLYDDEGGLWACTNRGVLFFSKQGNTLHALFQSLYINTAAVVKDKIILCSTAGAYLVDRETRRIQKKLLGENVESVFYDVSEGRLWLGTFRSGVFVTDVATWQGAVQTAGSMIPHNPVRAIEQLDDRNMLIGIDGCGVYAVTRDGRKASVVFSTDDNAGNVITGNGIYDILCDSHRNIWIGSYTGGIDIAFPTGGIIETVEYRRGNSQSLLCNGVNDILEYDGVLYFATDRGVSICNEADGQWRHALSGKVVLSLGVYRGEILAATYGEGIYTVSPFSGSRQKYSSASGVLTTDYVYSVWQDSRGGLWIGCLDGKLVHLSDSEKKYYDIETVQSVSDAPDGCVAVCTANGFHIIDPATGSDRYFLGAKEVGGRGINSYVCSVAFDSRNMVWVATDGGGVYLYNLSDRSIRQFTVSEGLPSNHVCGICKDAKGRVVVSTDDGLALIIPQTVEVFNINFIPRVRREYNRAAVEILKDGRIAFGSNSGAVFVNPMLIDRLSYAAKLRFTAVKVRSEEPLPDSELSALYSDLQKGSITLDNDNNSFTISFESIFFRYRNDIVYRHRLKGFKDTWSTQSTEEAVEFTNLPAGCYDLEVEAVSRNNGRVIDARMLKITVRRAWWNSLWAWVLYLSVVAVIVSLLLRNYRDRLQQRYFNEKIDFFINAAHDIRTPLSLVLAPLADLSADDGLSEKSRRCLDIARNNGDKLYQMISELLDFQKSDVIGNAVQKTDIKVSALLQTNVEKFTPLAQKKNILMCMASCPADVSVALDVRLSAKIFDNLLSNAIKYTPEGGMIVLQAQEHDGKVRIDVRDSGIGIPKSQQKNLFKMFFRADNAVKSRQQGYGIGLMLVKRIVALHDGKMTIDSEEGKGTTVSMTFDVSKTSPSLQDPSSLSEASEVLLFIDDNADFRNYISMSLADKYRVVAVESGEAALDYLKGNVCDIVVSDVMMPGIQGNELCRQIKENKDTSWMPVILLTARTGKDSIIDGLDCGADDYISKPFDIDILKKRIDTILANRRLASAYFLARMEERLRDASDMKNVAPAATSTPYSDEAEKDCACNNSQDTQCQTDVATEAMAIDRNEELQADSAEDTEKVYSEEDALFVDAAISVVLRNLSDTDFGIEVLCREMAMSRTLFYGRLKTLTGKTPQDFIRQIRLERAAVLLREGRSVLEVSAVTGFTNSKHFSTVFKKHFGVQPSKYK